MAHRPKVPLEIWEAVIDEVSGDRPSLYACSLACKSWVSRCRWHIFSKVVVNFDTVSQSARFLEIVQSSTNPGQYVRSLCISFGSGFYRDGTCTRPMAVLAENLTAVRELVLETTPCLDDDECRSLLSGFQTVRELTLISATFLTFTDFLELVKSFPILESLTCDDTVFDDENVPTHIMDLTPPHLNQLELCGPGIIQVIEWLLTTEYRVSAVTLYIFSEEEMRHCSEFLERLGQSVEILRLNLDSPELGHWIHNDTDIGILQNISLRSLRLSCSDLWSDDEPPLNVVPWVLSQVRSSEIHSLRFDLYGGGGWLDSFPWGDIDRILEHRCFAHLQHLTVGALKAGFDIGCVVRREMPRLFQRGTVEFVAYF